MISSLVLDDQIETENSTSRQLPARVCSSPHHNCQCAAAPLQSKFVFDLRLNIKQKISETTYRSAPKINTIIRLRDLLCYKMNKCFSECESIHATADTIIRVGVCVYPDTRSQSFLYPEAVDAEGVLGRRSHIGPDRCLAHRSLVSSSSCRGPSSKNSFTTLPEGPKAKSQHAKSYEKKPHYS